MIIGLVLTSLAVLVVPTRASGRRFDACFPRPTPNRSLVPNSLVVVGCFCTAALLLSGPHALVACGIASLTLRHRYVRSKSDRAHQLERRKLLDGLEILIGELRVGAHPSSACEAAALECSGVAAHTFAVAAARSRLGGSAAAGISGEQSVVAAEFARIAIAWRVAEKHGLALAELLDAARSDLLGRMRFRSRTESALAGARATGAVLAGLPLLGLVLGQLMGASPVRVLLGGGFGGALLIAGTVFACAGLLWTDAITGRVVA